MLAQERRFLLQIERPDTEDKGCSSERKREGKKAMDETKKEAAGAEECRNRNHVQLLSAASPPTRFPAGSARAASRRRPSGCHPRASCVPAECQATASEPPGADTSAREQPHRLRKPRMCQ